MADGFDECHKKRLVSKPGVLLRAPLPPFFSARSLYRMEELLRKGAPVCVQACVSSSIYIPVILMLIMLTY